MATKAKDEIFAGPSATAALMREVDWSKTPLGPVDSWPQSLRTSFSICLNSAFAILVWWGPELVMLYNDTYAPIISNKHPRALASCGKDTFPEIWETIGPMLEQVMNHGKALRADDLFLLLDRNGYPEECYFTFSYSPILDETGGVGGVFTPVQETTDRVIQERRLRTLTRLAAARPKRSGDTRDACRTLATSISEDPLDIPYASIYLFDEEGKTAYRAAHAGSAVVDKLSPESISERDNLLKLQSLSTGKPSEIDLSWLPVEERPTCATGRAIEQFILVPIRHSSEDKPRGFMIFGANPHKRLDESYLTFVSLVADHAAASIVDAEFFEAERKRTEALALIAEVRAASEKALRISESRVREVLERTTDAVFTLNRDWKFSFLNANAVSLISPNANVLHKGIWEEFPEAVGREFWRQYRRAMYERVPVEFEEFYPAPIEKWFEVHAYPTDEGIAVFFRDITTRRKTDHALRQSEKLAAAGRLAASISHEINNPLEAVTNLLYLIDMQADLPPESRQFLSMAQAELARVSHIATQTLRFYRQSTKPSQSRIPEILDSVVSLYEGRLRDARITVERRYNGTEPLLAFAGELRQVFANLVGNAVDAIGNNGRITLSERSSTDWKTGAKGVRITVVDSGHGMDRPTLQRLFEPFFSTKGLTGTGLGLWVSKEIIEKHAGKMKIRSTPGKGTAFSVFLPYDSSFSEAAQ